MIAEGLLSSWVALSPVQREAVREVYLRDRSVTDTAVRLRTGLGDVSRALATAYRRIAATVLEAADGDAPLPGGRVVDALTSLAALPAAGWTWDTSRENMTWSEGLFALYGYPVRAIRPSIGVHQAHKLAEDRAVVECLVLDAATARGPVVLPQRIVRTDGSVCRVVMHVVREPGPGEVLTGRVVADVGWSATSAGRRSAPR